MSEEFNDTGPLVQPVPEDVDTGEKRKATASPSANAKKRRKKYAKRAEVWEHFVQKEDDPSYANCKYCRFEMACDSKRVGTSSMKAHIERCKLYKDFDVKEKQKVIAGDVNGNLKVIKFDPVMFRRDVNEMILANELPFSFVESEGWKRFCFNVLPLYKTFSRRTSYKDIVGIYLHEKALLKNMFSVSSLTPYMVEFLLYTQQWLRFKHNSEGDVLNLVQMLEEVEFLDSLDSRNAGHAPP